LRKRLLSILAITLLLAPVVFSQSRDSGAIRGVGTKDRYASREEALYFERCRDRLTQENAKLTDVGVPICGVCIKVCPFGRPRA